MNIKKEKTSISPLIGLTDHDTFTTAQVLRNIVDAVEPMHNLATLRVQEDGEFAKLFAEQVAMRMENIFKLANDRISVMIEGVEEKALNNIA